MGKITARLERTTRGYEDIIPYTGEDFERQLDKIYYATQEKDWGERFDEVGILYQMFDEFNRVVPFNPIRAEDGLVKAVRINLGILDEHRNRLPFPEIYDSELRIDDRTNANLEPERRSLQVIEEAFHIYNEFYHEVIYSSISHRVIPDASGLGSMIERKLLEHYRDYALPAERMKQTVNDLTDPSVNPLFAEDDWENDSLRLRILKQFVKYGGGMRYRDGGTVNIVVGRPYIQSYVSGRMAAGGELWTGRLNAIPLQTLIDYLDEGVFDEFDTAVANGNKDLYKPGGRFELLRASDELACGTGKFTEETKRYLYLFALVYGMTYEIDKRDPDDVKDVNTLFRKFYIDDPARYLASPDNGFDGRSDEAPSGQGITRKNFEDLTYLYYLHKPISPEQSGYRYSGADGLRNRVFDADRMLRRLRSTGAPGNIGGTVTYNDLMKQYFGLDETDFEREVRQRYDCSVTIKTGDKAQNTAYRLYQFYIVVRYETRTVALISGGTSDEEQMHTLQQILNQLGRLGQDPAAVNQRFHEIREEENKDFEIWKSEQKGFEIREEEEEQKGFERLLKFYWTGLGIANNPAALRADGYPDQDRDAVKRLCSEAARMLNPFDPLIESAEEMNRSALLGIYYCCYVYLAKYYWRFPDLLKGGTNARPCGFGETRRDFLQGDYGDGVLIGADNLLDTAWYQTMDMRNILDALVIFSIYRKGRE